MKRSIKTFRTTQRHPEPASKRENEMATALSRYAVPRTTTFANEYYAGSGSGSGQGGSGSGSGAATSLQNAQNAQTAFTQAQVSGACQSYIEGTVGSLGDSELTATDVQVVASGAQVQGSAGDTMTIGEAMFPNNPELRTQLANPNQPVNDYFNEHPQTYAIGGYNGNTIIVNSNTFANLGEAQAYYTIFHETLHLMGYSDGQLEAAMNISPSVVRSQGSMSITYSLMGGCGQ
jgi:hypothetical protein